MKDTKRLSALSLELGLENGGHREIQAGKRKMWPGCDSLLTAALASLSIQQSLQDLVTHTYILPCPSGPEVVPAPLSVAQASCVIPCGFPYTCPLSSSYRISVCHLFLAGTLDDTLTKLNGHRCSSGHWINDSGALFHLLALLVMAVFRAGRQRTAICMWRQKLRVLVIPFFRIFPDL